MIFAFVLDKNATVNIILTIDKKTLKSLFTQAKAEDFVIIQFCNRFLFYIRIIFFIYKDKFIHEKISLWLYNNVIFKKIKKYKERRKIKHITKQENEKQMQRN